MNLQDIFDSYVGSFIEKGGSPAFVGEVRQWGNRRFQKQTKGWKELIETKEKKESVGIEGFTSEDESNIYNYTDDWYLTLNKKLIKGIDDEREELINNALDKLPDYKGKVWRGMSAIKELSSHSDDYQKGDMIRFDAFTSTTKKENGLNDFGQDILFEIESKTGKDISKFSLMPQEQEVLFKSKSFFEVKGKKEIKLGERIIKLYVKLKEI